MQQPYPGEGYGPHYPSLNEAAAAAVAAANAAVAAANAANAAAAAAAAAAADHPSVARRQQGYYGNPNDTSPQQFGNRDAIQYRRIDFFGSNYQNNNRGYFAPAAAPGFVGGPFGAGQQQPPQNYVFMNNNNRIGGFGLEDEHMRNMYPSSSRPIPSSSPAAGGSFYYYYEDAETELDAHARERQVKRASQQKKQKKSKEGGSGAPFWRRWFGRLPSVDDEEKRTSTHSRQRRRSDSDGEAGLPMGGGSPGSFGTTARRDEGRPAPPYHEGGPWGGGGGDGDNHPSDISISSLHPTASMSQRSSFGDILSHYGDEDRSHDAEALWRESEAEASGYYGNHIGAGEGYENGNLDYPSDENNDARYDGGDDDGNGVPSWKDQLGAAIQRDTIERFRNWGGLLAEIIVPLICVACTIILWAAFGDIVELEERVATNASRNLYVAKSGQYRSQMCYNDTWEGEANFIAGLSACSTLNATGVNVTCDGTHESENDIPVKGLCVESSGVGTFRFMSYASDLAMALPLDDIIAHHWMAKKQGVSQSADAALLISAGLATNNRYSAIGAGGKLFFAPKKNVPDELIAYLRANSMLFDYVYNGTFETVDEARELISSQSRGSTWALVDIKELSHAGMDVNINMNQSVLPSLDAMTDRMYYGGNVRDRADMYIISGFASLERALFDYFLQSSYSGLSSTVKASRTDFIPFFDSMGSPPYRVAHVLTVASTIIGFVVVLAFLYPVAQTTRRLVIEKERRIREAMLIMGMKSYFLSISWFLQCFCFNFVVSLLVTIMLRATFMRRSDAFAIFLVIFVFSLSTIPLAGLLASFFEKSRMAALLTPLIYFAISVPLFAMQSAPPVAITVLCLFSPTAFAHLLTIIFSAECSDGFSVKTLSSRAYNPRGEVVMGFLAADFGIYFVLMLYFDAVLPKEVGARKHPLFFIIDPIKWLARRCGGCCPSCCSSCGAGDQNGGAAVEEEYKSNGYGNHGNGHGYNSGTYALSSHASTVAYDDNQFGSPVSDDGYSPNGDPSRPFPATGGGGVDGRDPGGVYEEEDIPLRSRSVDVRGLRKQFSRGGKRFLAVNNLYWCMPNEGISVLLGHNGAGKSTALNMMTGMLRPDAGDCLVCGISVRDDLSLARQRIGFCPQHNILWPHLTCRQHLEFFAKIKGLRGAVLEDAVVKTLEEVDLLDKAEYQASGLSGGMKRKLSVAIAFVGGSPLVFLDEPTAGMDVAARRHTWELLLRMSRNRSVLLTTHFMDEADLLGDRIAIMSNGRLKCCGSSLFLKSRLGVGYNITMSVQPYASVRVLGDLVTRMVHGAEALSNSGCEVSYRLPSDEANSFPDLLAAIEDSGPQLGIRGYALSATTLEEVFLRVAEQDHRDLEAQREAERLANAAEEIPTITTAAAASMALDDSESLYASALSPETSPSRSADGYDNPLLASHKKSQRQQQQQQQQQQQTMVVAPNVADALWNSEIVTRDITIIRLQFSAMIRKRFYNTRRDSRMLCFQIICPVVCVLIAMFLNLVNMSGTESQSFAYEQFLDKRVVVDVSNCSRYFDSADPAAPASDSAKLSLEDPNTVDGYDLYDFTLDLWYQHGDFGRYGQIFCDSEEVRTKQLVPSSPVVLYYNSSSYHQVPVHMATFYNMALQGLTKLTYGDDSLVEPPKLRVGTHHLPVTSSEKKRQDAVKTILIGLIIMIPFTFLPSNCVSWIVKERECKSRHLQDISGLRFLIYWTTNFVYDIASYLVTLILVMLIFVAFQRQEYAGKDTVGATIVLFIVFGLCSTATAYVIHFAFTEHASAQLIVMAVGFITGFLLVIIVFILNLLEETRDTSAKMRYGFRVIPTFCVGEGIINLATLEQNKLQDPSLHAFSMDITGWPCVYMAVETPVFILLTLLIDHPYWKLLWQKRGYSRYGMPDTASEEDSDVEDERNQVISRLLRQSETGTRNLNDGMVDDAVSVVLLKKAYPNGKVAVRNVTFGVVPGEVFGFLGTNGAGKTTTISILCQEFLPTSGQAMICGYDIIDDRREALTCIGYCPQFDATLDLLTVREHLSVFAGIRSIAAETHDSVIADLLELTGLTEYKNTLAGELSGGNRRKLSVALSLIGGPRVVFLDEPSAGMDPVARRGLWTSIQKIANKCSIVLTTHHLEEVEALADCVAIMVDGGLRCIGDKTHLKGKYGSGFEMALRIVDVAYHDAVIAYVEENFPDATLNEFRGQRFVFALPKDVKLSEVFHTLQSTKDQVGISDYSISQTSIEQVFMRISDEAEEAERIRDLLARRKIAKENAQFIREEKARAKREAKRKKAEDKREAKQRKMEHAQKQRQRHGQRRSGGGVGGNSSSGRGAPHPADDRDQLHRGNSWRSMREDEGDDVVYSRRVREEDDDLDDSLDRDLTSLYGSSRRSFHSENVSMGDLGDSDEY